MLRIDLKKLPFEFFYFLPQKFIPRHLSHQNSFSISLKKKFKKIADCSNVEEEVKKGRVKYNSDLDLKLLW